MELLERQNAYNSFLEHLRCASERVLLLDYDGTIAPFNSDRNRAYPYPEIPPLLGRIIANGTRLVFITGRPAEELARLTGLNPPPEIWGSHGLEHLTPDGSYHITPLPPGHQAGLLTAAERVESQGLASRLERKPGSVALHWRGLSGTESDTLRNRILQLWIPMAAEFSLKLVNFDGGIEILTPLANKGNAINSIIGHHVPDAAIAYLGDDQTDEDAFHVLKGRGLSILVRSEPRPTAADLRLQPPGELVEFLHGWLLACGGRV